jgi:hypothetical protein
MKAITVSALVKRVNRRLDADQRLRVTRGERMRLEVGDFHIIDVSLNAVVRADVDIEDLGRELGALRDNEVLMA